MLEHVFEKGEDLIHKFNYSGVFGHESEGDEYGSAFIKDWNS